LLAMNQITNQSSVIAPRRYGRGARASSVGAPDPRAGSPQPGAV
jgi:hypothetical protein